MADEKKVPHINDAGGVVAVCVLGADDQEYTWHGAGSVAVTHTSVKQEYYDGDDLKARTVEVNYVTVVMTLDPSLPQAQVPVQAAPKKVVAADAWDH